MCDSERERAIKKEKERRKVKGEVKGQNRRNIGIKKEITTERETKEREIEK